MKRFLRTSAVTGGFLFPVLAFLLLIVNRADSQSNNNQDATATNALQLVAQGRQIFRFDTFGDQAFWGDMLKLHEAIEGAANGGVGPGVSPTTALAVGLKVDVDALPRNLQEQVLHGKVNLNDPAVTLALLKLNAVVGVTGFFNSSGALQSMEFNARCVIPRSITRCLACAPARFSLIREPAASVIAWMAGPTGI